MGKVRLARDTYLSGYLSVTSDHDWVWLVTQRTFREPWKNVGRERGLHAMNRHSVKGKWEYSPVDRPPGFIDRLQPNPCCALQIILFFKDIDECDPANPRHRCSQICDNTPGSYKCSCQNGFGLNKDGYECEGIFNSIISWNLMICSWILILGTCDI